MKSSDRPLFILTALLPCLMGLAQETWGLAGALFILFASPLLDLWFRSTGQNRWEETIKYEDEGKSHLYQISFLFYAITFILFFLRFVFMSHTLSLASVITDGISWGLIGGIPTLIVGHSLIHGTSKWKRSLGKITFAILNYPSFPRIHMHVHHRFVASDLDCHSARTGQSFYHFFIVGCFREIQHLKNKKEIILLELIRYLVVLGVGVIGGWFDLSVYLGTTLLTRIVIWLVNYVQHYGLSGRDHHSWDVNFRSTNLLFFNSGLHSDHHSRASVNPSELKIKSALTFPYNFPMILIVALVPPIFFRKMEERKHVL